MESLPEIVRAWTYFVIYATIITPLIIVLSIAFIFYDIHEIKKEGG